MRSHWMTHNDKKVFWAAYDHINVTELATELAEVLVEIKKQPAHSVLALTDTRGLIVTPQVLSLLAEQGKAVNPYMRHMAILGVNGSVRQKMFEMVVKIIGSNMAPTQLFDEDDAALDWLAK